MDEINNNQMPEMPVLAAKHPDLKIFAGVVILVFLAIYVVLTISIKMQSKTSVLQVPVLVPTEVAMPDKGPQKNDLAGEVPISFASSSLLESKNALQESYIINYPENEQSTIVFLSLLSPQEKYAEYSNQLAKDRWVIMKKYESDNLYSLYALKEKDELNITISTNTGVNEVNKSQVSISLLSNK